MKPFAFVAVIVLPDLVVTFNNVDEPSSLITGCFVTALILSQIILPSSVGARTFTLSSLIYSNVVSLGWFSIFSSLEFLILLSIYSPIFIFLNLPLISNNIGVFHSTLLSVSCVQGSPIDCAATTPTISLGWAILFRYFVLICSTT